MAFFNLIRFQNLIIIILTQYFVRLFLFEKFGVLHGLNFFNFSLLILSTILIAAAGNIINDFYDLETDRVNKASKVILEQKINKKTAFFWYIVFNLLGILIGFFLSLQIEKPDFSLIFIGIAALLFFYSKSIKSTFLLGNILVSLLTAMVFLVVGLFDLLPNISNLANQKAFDVLWHFVIFGFLINLLREMVKDQEDINGDYKAGMKTMPLVLGRKRANKVIFAFGFLPVLGIGFYLYQFLQDKSTAALFVLFFMLLPLFYFLIKIFEAKKTKDYKHLSLLLKTLMLVGVLAIALYPAN